MWLLNFLKKKKAKLALEWVIVAIILAAFLALGVWFIIKHGGSFFDLGSVFKSIFR